MLFKEAVSKRIYELCDLYRYTPNKLAELSGIPPSTFQDLLSLRGDRPNAYIIYQICKTLKIKVKDFYDSELFENLID